MPHRNVADPVNGSGFFGKRRWAIAEGYIPGESVEPEDPALKSHEAACLLNVTDRDADITITVFFENRDPAGPYQVRLPARRTKHLRFNELRDPELIPRDTSYSSLIESSVPIVVQHTRLDARRPSVALLSTVAFALE
ncbi:MAG TPA: sensory rhodopsin transducer [Rhizomicrobium sp.]|jgi:hypothetical protein